MLLYDELHFMVYNICMTRQLTKSGNSIALVLSKDMRDHLGLTDNQIEVIFEKNSISLRAPMHVMSFEDAADATFEQFDTALKNLAK
jgi:antitoxin component of MazEF toxin-antitoxin module